MSNAEIPNYEELVTATLEALVDEQRGGSASNQEIAEDVAVLLDLSDEALEIPHGDEGRSEFYYRAAWARTFLRHMRAIENSSRGVWSVTDHGRQLAESEEAVRESYREIRRQLAKRSSKKTGSSQSDPETTPDDEPPGEPDGGDEWQDTLLATLRTMPPGAFERLCQRVLREKGFTRVEVTGQTGDGGIDGIGVLRVNLISFQIVFQCKRYADSVGSGAIRDFRGSMVGRADKGLFITTGRFSPSAEREAVRDGAPAIDLINGVELCELLRELGLGVKEQVTVDEAFFASI